MMKFDLIRPCENCPFANTETRIKFTGRQRAEEIAEQAYREGFVCHEHADWVEAEDDLLGGGGAYERQDGSSQHCFGAVAMYVKQGSANIPWEEAMKEDPGLEERWWARVDMDALATIFEDEEAFKDANHGRLPP